MKLDRLLHQLDDPSLSRDERALLRCELAKKLEEAGDYGAAREALGELWPSFGERPDTEGLDRRAAAEVLLRTGALVGWIGSVKQIAGAQERAKNLISESAGLFEALKDVEKATEARIELAVCYWREGAIDEARVMLRDAIDRLADTKSDLKAIALVRSGMVEKVATRYSDALRILNEAAPLVEASGSHALKGKFHNELATVLKNLGTAEHREDYIDRALIEYAAAGFHFEQAGHSHYQACVENNLGFLYSQVGRYDEAHEHLNRARRLLAGLKDAVHVAQVDETRARAMLAEGRNAEAERIARAAVNTLDDGGEHQLLAEALTTHGTALARLGRQRLARVTLQRAVAVAGQAGDKEGAGHATLTLIEELGESFSPGELGKMYARASELLAASQYPATRARLTECAGRVLRAVGGAPGPEAKRAEVFRPPAGWHGFHFWTELRRYEAYLIRRALKDADGVVTRAAQLLGFKHHQSLNALLKGRHRNLLHLRRPIEPRKRSAFRVGNPRNISEYKIPKAARRPATILHVEDDKLVAGTVKDMLELEGWKVETCAEGASALDKLAGGARYDLLIFDNDLPGASGVELTLHARRLPRLRRTPIIMFSANPCADEARRAGANIFLNKPEDLHLLVEIVGRLLDAKARGR